MLPNQPDIVADISGRVSGLAENLAAGTGLIDSDLTDSQKIIE